MRTIILSIVGIIVATLSFGQTNQAGSGKMDDPIEYIKKESSGGKLDFYSELEKENNGFYLYEGVAYNKKDFAIFLWGQAVKRLGIESGKVAAKLWEEINKRKLTGPEKKALSKGFNAQIK